jgi:hypothetical protein
MKLNGGFGIVSRTGVAMLGLLLALSCPAAVVFQSYESRTPVPADQLTREALQSWVVALADEGGGETALWDLQIDFTPGSRVLAGTSSELLFLAVIEGAVAVTSTNAAVKGGPLVAGPGDAVYAGHDAGSGLRRAPFSAERLLATLEQAGRSDLAGGLDVIASRQQRRMAWGLLRPTRLNIASPLRAGPENLRKSYLNQPEILSLRRASTTPADLAQAVASQFVSGLAKADASIVGHLISPRSFDEAVKNNALQAARQGFARELLRQPWVKGVDPASVKPSEFLPLAYEFSAGGERYEVHLEPFDATYFVKSVLPLSQ